MGIESHRTKSTEKESCSIVLFDGMAKINSQLKTTFFLNYLQNSVRVKSNLSVVMTVFTKNV